MKHGRRLVVAAVAAALMVRWTQAGGVGVTAKVGSLGLGADLTAGLTSYLNLRAGFNALSHTEEMELDEADVTGKLKLRSFPLLLDWHPFESGFRISGGVLFHDNKIALSADPREPIELQDTEYAIESLDGEISFDSPGEYLGIGYGNAVDEDGRWHFAFDLGLLHHGRPRVEATAVAANPALQNRINADLEQEVTEFEEDAKSFRFYPVLSVGVSFRF